MKRKILVFLTSLVFLSVVLAGVFYILTKQFLFEGAEKTGREVIYEVRIGQSFNSIAHDLQERGIVKSAEAFALYGKFTRQIPAVKAGEYRFETSMTPPQVMGVLVSGRSVARAMTVPEGYSVFEIADLIESKGFAKRSEILKLAFDRDFVKQLLGEEQASLEGYLYPDTYQFTKYMTAEGILTQMVKMFLTNFERVPQPYPFNWTRHQVVTMASLIEKETGAPYERTKISSVFSNRIKKNMRLQTDPTIIYAKALNTGKLVIDIRKADLTMDHPYNTYVRSGLPPGPIANPGLEALGAAVSPATTNYLFFVSRNDGTHIFSESYDQHSKAVRKHQVDPKARQGKSWRDLKKKAVN